MFSSSNVISAVARGTFALKLTTTDDDKRLDLKTKGLWESRFNENNFDVNPPAGRTLLVNENRSEAFKENESFEKNKYNQRITEVERAKFYPLASSTTGGAAL